MTGRSPFSRMPNPEPDATRPDAVRFINPWAECWGDPAAAGPQQMSASVGSTDTDEPDAAPCDPVVPAPSAGALQRVFPIINQRGLHARASAKFVQTVERFNAEIRVSRCGETVGGLSIMGLMMLAAGHGSKLKVSAAGSDAEKFLDEIEQLVASRFNED